MNSATRSKRPKVHCRPERQRRATILTVRSDSQKTRSDLALLRSVPPPIAAAPAWPFLPPPPPPPHLLRVHSHLLIGSHGNATESLYWSEPYSRVDLFSAVLSCLMITAAVLLVDAVGAVQLPLVCDGGASADLHLHLPQDALPLTPHPPDRVRLHTRLSFSFINLKEYCCDVLI